MEHWNTGTEETKEIILAEEKTISFRLDSGTDEKLKEIMKARGLNKTDAIKFCIHGIPILRIGNIKELSKELYQIREMLEGKENLNACERRLEELCQYIFDLLQKIEGPNE